MAILGDQKPIRTTPKPNIDYEQNVYDKEKCTFRRMKVAYKIEKELSED